MMFSLTRMLVIGLLALLTLGSALAMEVSQQGNRLLVDGKPTPLLFARGCTDPAEVPAYRALGFNTLLVRIDSPGTVAMEQARALLQAGEDAGMYLLVELANGSWSEGQRAAITSTDYQENAGYFIHDVVSGLNNYPHLIGWIIDTVQEDRLLVNLGYFGSYLQERYGTLDALNGAWLHKDASGRSSSAVKLVSFSSITEQLAQTLAAVGREDQAKAIRRDLEAYGKLKAQRDTDFQQYLHTYYSGVADVNKMWGFTFTAWEKISIDAIQRRQQDKQGSSPMSQLELARYRSESARVLFDWWCKQINEVDKGHLIFAGGMNSYRFMSNLPSSLNGVYTECYPGVTESDADAHNPHAIDIARHGNRFIVLAGISAESAEPGKFAYYLYGTALHGAAGIGVQDWPTINNSAGLQGILSKSLADIGKRNLLERTPAPQQAIVYAPYTPGRYTSGKALYGYLPLYITDGPGLLMFTLRNGTCYGQLDYLAPGDLADLPLQQYQTIILPTTLDLPEKAQLALRQYVEGGGIVLADLGAGSLQATGNHVELPAVLMDLFRLRNRDSRVSETRMNLEAYRSHPLFPHVLAGMRSMGLAEGYAIRYTAKFIPLEGADLLFTLVPKREMQPPVLHPYRPLPQQPTQGVFISGRGKGYAIFASAPLYQGWTPGMELFEDFHRDLFGHNAAMSFEAPIDFLPTQASLARYADGSVALWTKDEMKPVAWLNDPDRHIYALPGGQCEISPDGTRLFCGTPGYNLAEPLPVTMDRVNYAVSTDVRQADAHGLIFSFSADRAQPGKTIKLQVSDGAYRIAPGATYRLTILTNASATESLVKADAHGFIEITAPLSPSPTTISLGGMETVIDTASGPDDSGAGEVEIEALPETK